jgi:hypothetical protein
MYHIALAAIVLATASGDLDDGCGELGLESAAQAEEFCEELRAIARPPGTTRNLDWNNPADGEAGEAAGPTGITIIDRAYRTDPRKTLELIQRIKSAGGLSGSAN